jgi:acetate kinase
VRILVVNAGSSSLRLSVVTDGRRAADTEIERWEGESDLDVLHDFIGEAGGVDAVGHRVVHGGPRFTAGVVVDDEVVDYLASIIPLAPLHQLRAVRAMRDVGRLLSDVPTVAAFDTSFHASIPPAASTYALPREWNERWKLRRYGFHGLSHAYASRRAAEMMGTPVEGLRLVTCHLGAGASLAAVLGGRSVDTTMGFTPLEGLVMRTRSGSVDPGLVTWLLTSGGFSVRQLDRALEGESGLRGLSGTSGDLRDVLAGRDLGDRDCALAYDVFLHSLVRETGAMTAATGGLDALVFTGGIGEHSAPVRHDAVTRLGHLGVGIDATANDEATSDTDLTSAGATARVLVIRAAEDLEVAREGERLLGAA